MKKVILTCIVALLAIILVVTINKGIHIGNFEVASLSEIKEQNEQVDNKIESVEKLNNQTYPYTRSMLDTAINTYEVKKSQYIDLVNSKSISEIEAATKEETYEIEFLWTYLGLYATNNNIWLKANVTTPSNGLPSQYDINITARGGYTQIKNYIYSIENDTNLGFKIEDFSLIPYRVDNSDDGQVQNILEGKFTIRNVAINLVNLSNTSTNDGGVEQ